MKERATKWINLATATSPTNILATSDVELYEFYGSKTLGANFLVDVSGTPTDGTIIWMAFQSAITCGSYDFTIINRVVNPITAAGYFWAIAVYTKATWTVFIVNVAKEGDGISISDSGTGSLGIKTGSITNAMVNASAAIAYTKLSLAGAILNSDINASAAIAYSKLALTGSIVNADINASAAIAYTKLALTGAILNADINASAAIAYSKLALTGSIVNADINASAAIAYSKLALTGSILNADINASAAIALSKLATVTADRLLISDHGGLVSAADTTTYPSLTELSYLKGVTSAIQTQISAGAVPRKVDSATLSGTTILTSTGLKTTYLCDVSGGGFTVTLPVANTLTADTTIEFIVWGHNTNTLTVQRGSTDIIMPSSKIGTTSATSTGFDTGLIFICDGSSSYKVIIKGA